MYLLTRTTSGAAPIASSSALLVSRPPAAIDRRDDRAVRDEEARNLDRGFQQAAAVVAQVEDVALRTGVLAGEHRLTNFVVRGLSEVGQSARTRSRLPSSRGPTERRCVARDRDVARGTAAGVTADAQTHDGAGRPRIRCSTSSSFRPASPDCRRRRGSRRRLSRRRDRPGFPRSERRRSLSCAGLARCRRRCRRSCRP